MRFHLAHMVPADAMHGLHGYREVIDTVHWGLTELGHTVTYGLNELVSGARNIVFGAQVMEMDALERLPPETIVYNFEQARNVAPESVRPQLHLAAQRFEVWDYCEANMPLWERLGALRAELVPVGFAPILQRIPRDGPQDIDVLMYGLTGSTRVNAFHHLCHAGLSCVFVCGLYGEARDQLIARSRLVVNTAFYENSKIFEIVRVSYLMANRKAVVAQVDPGTFIEDDVASGVRFVEREGLLAACRELVGDRAARERLEEAAFEAIARRDIRAILREVVD